MGRSSEIKRSRIPVQEHEDKMLHVECRYARLAL